MELFTRETIGNYTSDRYKKNDHKYSKKMQEKAKNYENQIKKLKKMEGLLI